MLRASCIAFIAMAWAAAQPASASVIRYTFEGTASFVSNTPYGTTAGTAIKTPPNSKVTGGFAYESNSVGTIATTTKPAGVITTTTYHQTLIPGGFYFDFLRNTGTGTVRSSADYYDIMLLDNNIQPDGSKTDQFNISFKSNSNPLPEGPLTYGGTTRAAGQMTIVLLAPSTLFSSGAVLKDLRDLTYNSPGPHNFTTSQLNIFGATATGVNVIFSLTSLQLQSVPEPSTCRLLIAGALVLLGVTLRSRASRRLPELCAR